jgi:uncharacterized protein YkwD
MPKAGLLTIAFITVLMCQDCSGQSFWRPNHFDQLDLKRTVVAKAVVVNGSTTISLLVPTWQQEQMETRQPTKTTTMETRTKTETQSDGTQVEVPYQVQVTLDTTVERVVNISKPLGQKRVEFPIENFKAWLIDGRQLDQVTLTELLREPRHILALPQGISRFTPDPYYSSILQPNTLVMAISNTAFPESERIAPRSSAAVQPPTIAVQEATVIELTNRERAKHRLPELKRNEQLMEAARKHSQNMAAKRILSHDLEGKSFLDRAQAEGYKFAGGGENIAEGAINSIEVVSMWMKSPGHRSNILDASYSEIGVGFALDANGRRFDTQVFGRPATTFINNSGVD